MLPRAERPMPFRETLPPDKQALLWLPFACVTLTLPDYDGSHTAFTVHRCPTEKLLAHNVATYRRARANEEGGAARP